MPVPRDLPRNAACCPMLSRAVLCFSLRRNSACDGARRRRDGYDVHVARCCVRSRIRPRILSKVISGFIGRNCVFTARRYASAVYTVVCLSVCPSVTRRYCTKMAKRKIMQTPRDSCFLTLKISATFRRRLSQRGRQTEVEWVQIGDF